MPIELKIPSAGESITEVTIAEWLVEEGGTIRADETVALIETDKANVELPAPQSGTVTKILKPAGEVAEVGEVIGYLEAGEVAAKPAAKPAETKPAAPTPAETKPAPAAKPAEAIPKGPPGEPPIIPGTADLRASPSVRRAMLEQRLDPNKVQGSGPGGRIEHGDVQGRSQIFPATGARTVERVTMTRLRRRIAQRLVESQQTAALLTTFNEVDMSAVMALRKQHQESFKAKHGIKLGFMSFFVKAVIEGLKDYPALNAAIEGDEILYHDYYDVGVAVGGGKGLVVPVVRNAERLSFAQVEKVIADFGKRARDNRLKVEELQGGTFTISNGGIYGSLMSTPIINPPQSGILGMHAIQERPVVRNGACVPAPMMFIALTYDHRLVDGREAVSFLVRVKETIESPARILLEV